MRIIERVMRVMTHVNIGATIGTAAWILWSGAQVVIGAPGTSTGSLSARYGVKAMPVSGCACDAAAPRPNRVAPPMQARAAAPTERHAGLAPEATP